MKDSDDDDMSGDDSYEEVCPIINNNFVVSNLHSIRFGMLACL